MPDTTADDMIRELGEAADTVARMCKEPEPGLGTWWLMLGRNLERLAEKSGGMLTVAK